MTDTITTPYAAIHRTGPHEVEIHFTAGITLNSRSVAEVIRERIRMCAGQPTGLLLIIPPDTELDMSVMNTDNLKTNHATDQVLAFAVVAGNATAETLLRLYKAYYPSPFDAEVFTDEEVARAWLRRRIAKALEATRN